MTDLICFDCDGVLVDSEWLATETMVECLSSLGVKLSIAEASEMFTGKSAAHARDILRQELGVDLSPSMEARYDDLLLQRFHHQLRAVSGIRAVLSGLEVPSCVTSNSGHRRLALSLRLTGLAEHFGNNVFSAEDVAEGKPAPDLFYFAAARLGADVRRCTVIDDSVSGISGAVAAGAYAIGFTGGSHCGPESAATLLAAGASFVVGSAQELADYLRDQSAWSLTGG